MGRRTARRSATRWVVSAAGLAVLAAAAYAAGRTTAPWCDRESLAQPHAAWHALSAAALGLWGTVLWPTDPSGPHDGDSR